MPNKAAIGHFRTVGKQIPLPRLKLYNFFLKKGNFDSFGFRAFFIVMPVLANFLTICDLFSYIH